MNRSSTGIPENIDGVGILAGIATPGTAAQSR